jgi:hypothetical protein
MTRTAVQTTLGDILNMKKNETQKMDANIKSPQLYGCK